MTRDTLESWKIGFLNDFNYGRGPKLFLGPLQTKWDDNRSLLEKFFVAIQKKGKVYSLAIY